MFIGITCVKGILPHFTQLKELCIIQQPELGDVSVIKECPALETLYVCETNVSSLACFSQFKCTGLQRLFLYANQIDKIQGLQQFRALTELNLNRNKIGLVEGLQTLTK